MSTLISRLFARNDESALYEEVCNDPRRAILVYLYDLASNSVHLSELQTQISDTVFDKDPFFADMQLVQNYLMLENYLIRKDPKFIGSALDLRTRVHDNFPELVNSGSFKLLLENESNQGALLARVYLNLLLNRILQDHPDNSDARDWLERIAIRFPDKSKLNIVERINLLRRLKEASYEMYHELVEVLGVKVTERYYFDSYTELGNIYKNLKGIKDVNDVIPNGQDVPKGIPVRKLITLEDSKDPQSSDTISNAQYKSILENILDGFILIDKKMRIVEANNTAMQIMGLRPNTLKFQNLKEFLPEEISSGLQQDLNRHDSSIPSVILGKRHETILTTKDGKHEDYEISITNNYDSEKKTYSVLLTNISHKKHMLDAIRDAKVNAERTAKAKSTFLSNMSHEIRTPLNVILGLSEMIKKGVSEENEVLLKNIEGIDFSAQNLLSIVNDILDFSKIEAGKLTIQSIDFNLRKVVENLSDGFEIKAKEKGLTLVSEMGQNIPDIVIGDQYRLNQILTNLIGNAIKFTKDGQISIGVKMISEYNDEVKLQFKVKDTGIGISKENLSKIFDSFFQVENREEMEMSGTGLGLAITKELIKLQDGDFTATSELGVGSEFKFTLPFTRSKLKSLNDSIKTFVRQDKKLEGLKVLVAEDNKMNQFYIKQLLTNLNVSVDIAENGQEAIEIFEQDKSNYDLILMDMHMPVMNGIEAITKIRKTNKDLIKKVPIVACSADVFPEARKSAIKAGIDFYLTKPLSEDAVKEVLFWLISDEEFDPNKNLDNITTSSKTKEKESRSVDMNLLKETFDNDEEFIASLLEVFIQTTPEDYKSMRHCIDREYYSRASSLAHKMKSSFQNLGMTVHGHHLQQIESNIIKTESIEEAKKHLTAFSQMYTKALLEVNLLLIELKHK
ncbi:MAG: response regulator [Bacteroidia bacterium]|nr:response regulator [Bacteroidia bacterium]MBT8276226.1 response regulator [Bacteroidia bacterium]NNJ83045.1 response regulator [Flavobacteriaceae bacterium]NNK53364.1 response regulator [Flavobacteriaceae bacterium]